MYYQFQTNNFPDNIIIQKHPILQGVVWLRICLGSYDNVSELLMNSFWVAPNKILLDLQARGDCAVAPQVKGIDTWLYMNCMGDFDKSTTEDKSSIIGNCFIVVGMQPPKYATKYIHLFLFLVNSSRLLINPINRDHRRPGCLFSSIINRDALLIWIN